MNEIPKMRARSNPNPSSSKEIERRTSDEQEERGMQGITRRHDLLALKVGRTSRKGKLGELQNLPTKDLQNEIPLVKSFWSTRGMKWWSGSEDLVEENHHGRGLSGGAAAMVEEHGW
jgi:hypothetical protein